MKISGASVSDAKGPHLVALRAPLADLAAPGLVDELFARPATMYRRSRRLL